MFEEAFAQLDSLGVAYTQGEDGSVTIDIAEVDKTTLIDIIAFLEDNAITFTIDQTSINIAGSPEVIDDTSIESMVGDDTSATDTALAELGL